MPLETVSTGSTPSLHHDFPMLDGVTEIRPGTCIFMDASQSNAYGSFKRNAATVISPPAPGRVIMDVGAKVEIISNHICPVVKLHENAYLVSGGEVVDVIPVACRVRLQ